MSSSVKRVERQVFHKMHGMKKALKPIHSQPKYSPNNTNLNIKDI